MRCMSWKLYRMLTRDVERLLIISEEPLEQVWTRTRPSIPAFVSRRGVLLGSRKYTSGTTPPTRELATVAAAAPATPQGRTPTSR